MTTQKEFGEYRTEFIPLKSLKVHPKVQRSLISGWVNALAKAWNPEMCRPLNVIKNCKGYFVFDGQHRMEAAKLVYGTEQRMPCWVFQDLTIEDEAALFLGMNNVRIVRLIDKWMVREIAKDPVVLAIKSILSEFELSVTKEEVDGGIRAVGALENIYLRHDGGMLLRRTLTVINLAWGIQSEAYDGIILKGLGTTLEKFGDKIEHEELAAKLRKHGLASSLVGEARSAAKYANVQVGRAMIEAILRVWNRGKNEKSRLTL